MGTEFKRWRGPVLGQVVSQVLSSPKHLALEFGELTAEVDRQGRECIPQGEWTLATIKSWPAWTLRAHDRVIATAKTPWKQWQEAVNLLSGRRLRSVEFNRRNRTTRLKFSLGIELTTVGFHQLPHWVFRKGDRWERLGRFSDRLLN